MIYWKQRRGSLLEFLIDIDFSLKPSSLAPVLALYVLAISQLPIAIKTSAELACIGEVSNQLWKRSKTHANVNVIAVQKCNGAP